VNAEVRLVSVLGESPESAGWLQKRSRSSSELKKSAAYLLRSVRVHGR